MKKVVIFFAVLAFIVSGLFAGPFGIEMGWTVEDLKNNGITFTTRKKTQNITTYDVFPKTTHPSFESYSVAIDDVKGVYKINIFGNDIETSIYGIALKEEYEKIKNQISITYGTPKSYDYLRSGSIWDEPNEWMKSLEKEERVLHSFWYPVPKETIESIFLEAIALGSDSGYLFLSYQSNDIDEILARRDSALSNVF
ncbi:MAG TPA: hypothetical protein VJ869_09320 [Sphaerochaeta sp.]|nr:hypothetical protein [Sphaerochaeta sp.]